MLIIKIKSIYFYFYLKKYLLQFFGIVNFIVSNFNKLRLKNFILVRKILFQMII